MTQTVVLWLVPAMVFFWALGAYNRLVRLRAQVLTTFVAVDERHGQSLLLVAQRAKLPAPPPDSRFPQAPALAPGDEFEGLRGALAQFEVALRLARKHPLDANAVAALRTADATLQMSWERLPVDPSQQPTATGRSWDDNQHATREVVQRFNQAVDAYNHSITQFPALLLAAVFGFRAAAAL